MGWLGLDDTDSLAGGCTTAVFEDLLNGLPASTSIGVPRLVRLWHFAQRRTRGNAALGVEVHTDDVPGLLHHLDVWWTSHIVQLAGAVESSDVSDRQQSPASPGMVWFADQPPMDLYDKAVREEVLLEELPIPVRAWAGMGGSVRRLRLLGKQNDTHGKPSHGE